MQSNATLRTHVAHAMDIYFQQLGGHEPCELYNFVIREVEAPLIQSVLNYTGHNQLRTAKILGMSRGTLRKKIKELGLTKHGA